MNITKRISFLFAVFLVLSNKAQVTCDSSNSPTFSLTTSQVTLSTSGYCGMLINIMSAVTNPIPGGPISYSLFAPGQPSIPVVPIPTIIMSPGLYTVTVTDNTNLCKTTKTVQVTVLQAPLISIVASNSVCSGNMATLTASGANSYTWSTGANTVSIFVNPTPATVYNVVGTGTNACASSASTSLNVIVYPSPSVVIADAPYFICFNDSVSFTASGAISYTWSNSQTGPKITVSPTVSTSYTVTGAGANGCHSNAQVYVGVLICTTVMTTKIENEILEIYPIPAADQIELSIFYTALLIEFHSLAIYNNLGQAIREEEITLKDNSAKINTSNLAPGIYSVRLRNGSSETISRRFVIAR